MLWLFVISGGGLVTCGVGLKVTKEKEEAERALRSAESHLSSCKSNVRQRGKLLVSSHYDLLSVSRRQNIAQYTVVLELTSTKRIL